MEVTKVIDDVVGKVVIRFDITTRKLWIVRKTVMSILLLVEFYIE